MIATRCMMQARYFASGTIEQNLFRLDICIDGWIDKCVHWRVDRWIDRLMDTWIDIWEDRWLYII